MKSLAGFWKEFEAVVMAERAALFARWEEVSKQARWFSVYGELAVSKSALQEGLQEFFAMFEEMANYEAGKLQAEFESIYSYYQES
jgi:hypothetical protein